LNESEIQQIIMTEGRDVVKDSIRHKFGRVCSNLSS